MIFKILFTLLTSLFTIGISSASLLALYDEYIHKTTTLPQLIIAGSFLLLIFWGVGLGVIYCIWEEK